LKHVRSGFDDGGGGVLELGRCHLKMATEEREECHMNREETRRASGIKGKGEH